MEKLPKFLSCNNPLADNFLDYILHTQKPKALFKVLENDKKELTIFETLQEIDRFSDFTVQQIEALMKDLRQFYVDQENFMAGAVPVFMITPLYEEARIVALEDAHALNLLDSKTYEIPPHDIIERVTFSNYVKVCYKGQMFWCIVADVDRKGNRILAYITEELLFLQKHGLDQGDGIIIKIQHIFEIQK